MSQEIDARAAEPASPTLLTGAVVKVGYGRGFIIEAEHEQRYIITAAHCLPRSRYPRPHLANCSGDLMFRRIIGPVGSKRSELSITADVCVLDLCDDVAVLAASDNQSFGDESDQYERFTEPTALAVAKSPAAIEPYNWSKVPGENGWILSLNLTWVPCTIYNGGRFLSIKGALIESGMSGSPILNAEGAAIGLISTSGIDIDKLEVSPFNLNPSLSDCLPSWLLRKLERVPDMGDVTDDLEARDTYPVRQHHNLRLTPMSTEGATYG